MTIYYAFKQSETETKNDVESLHRPAGRRCSPPSSAPGSRSRARGPLRQKAQEGRSLKVPTPLHPLSSLYVASALRARPWGRAGDFVMALKRELHAALDELRSSNIAPVDLAQSAIGPGIGVYSRFSQVLEADGSPMTVRAALQIINQELDAYFSDQDGELDRESRFCVDLYTQKAFDTISFGEADVLARAKNVSIEGLAAKGRTGRRRRARSISSTAARSPTA